MKIKNNTYGLVVCGGKSTRMGRDKSLLIYHQKPQRYDVYERLEEFCESTFISCNLTQVSGMDKDYQILVDLPAFAGAASAGKPASGIGPMAALLTAFSHHPQHDFLVMGCDYPFVTEKDIHKFLAECEHETRAAAFYNEKQDLYEPLLGWYSHRTAGALMKLFEQNEYSLQYFLQTTGAGKYYSKAEAMNSVDTPESMVSAQALLQTKIETHAVDRK